MYIHICIRLGLATPAQPPGRPGPIGNAPELRKLTHKFAFLKALFPEPLRYWFDQRKQHTKKQITKHKQTKNTHAQTELQPQTKLTHEQRSQNQVWLSTLHRSCIPLLLACVHHISLETTDHYADSHWSVFWRYHLLRMRGSS